MRQLTAGKKKGWRKNTPYWHLSYSWLAFLSLFLGLSTLTGYTKCLSAG